MPLIKLLLAHKIIAALSAGIFIFAGGGATLLVLSQQQPEVSTTTSTQKPSSTDSSSLSTDTEKDDKKDDKAKSSTKTSPAKPKSSSGTTTPKSSSSTGSTSGGTSSPAPSGGTTTPSIPSGGFQANCITKPSACGYPDASNTGPSGTLTNSGSITVTQNGAVVQNLNITGHITVNADNVTIRNVRITSGDYYPISYNRSGLVVEDTEIIGTSTGVTSGIAFANYTARRVEVRGTADGFKADANVVIQDSYIHGLRETSTSHNDGIQATGGSNVIVRHNTFALSGTNAEVMQFNGTNSNWIIENNLLDGGGWVFNASSLNGTPIRNNRFTRTQGYGIAQISGATYTGNYYDDNGAAIVLK